MMSDKMPDGGMRFWVNIHTYWGSPMGLGHDGCKRLELHLKHVVCRGDTFWEEEGELAVFVDLV